MAVIQIRKAQREGARLVIGIAGVSGSGKTYTALQLGYGLANGDSNKLGFLDTENRRGSLYADALPEPFLIGDLPPPFSPTRYIEAINEFQRAGVEVLIVDSVSHEYEGIGGIQEIAEAGNPKMPNWNKAKAEHKKFMNALLACDMHIICCVRAREKAKPERVNGKMEYVDLGLQPIAEKNMMFEMTASVMMHDLGNRQDVLKCPADLIPMLARGEGYITQDDGRKIRAWVDGAKQLDPQVERFRNALQSVTEQGTDALRDAWGKTPANIKQALGEPFLDTLKASARAFDESRAAETAPASAAADAVKAASQAQPQSQTQARSQPEARAEEQKSAAAPEPAANPATAQAAAVSADDDVF